MEEVIHVSKDRLVRSADLCSLAAYRTDCMNGEPHPLNIEQYTYRLTTIATRHLDDFATHSSSYTASSNKWSYPGQVYLGEDEQNYLKNLIKEPAVEWAVDNSFDGLYIHRTQDQARMAMVFKIAAYLKEEHLTFWKLKYGGTYE